MNTIKIPTPEVPSCWQTNDGRTNAWKAGFFAGYQQCAEDNQPKVDKYAKTQLDKWDNLVVFYAKGWFDAISPETSMVDELRAIMAERCALDFQYVKAESVVSLILSNIINPFVLDGEPRDRIVCRIIEDSAPDNIRNMGKPYDYYEAILGTLISIISCTQVKYLPGLTHADKELFRKCIERIKK